MKKANVIPAMLLVTALVLLAAACKSSPASSPSSSLSGSAPSQAPGGPAAPKEPELYPRFVSEVIGKNAPKDVLIGVGYAEISASKNKAQRLALIHAYAEIVRQLDSYTSEHIIKYEKPNTGIPIYSGQEFQDTVKKTFLHSKAQDFEIVDEKFSDVFDDVFSDFYSVTIESYQKDYKDALQSFDILKKNIETILFGADFAPPQSGFFIVIEYKYTINDNSYLITLFFDIVSNPTGQIVTRTLSFGELRDIKVIREGTDDDNRYWCVVQWGKNSKNSLKGTDHERYFEKLFWADYE